ncbi:serine hydrolase domain-containing protein [Undibacterium sp. WLHG33]|uniref:serine hydrolase domain-containing protein n=1 Tax=Undibacterium sp. WLHG33 TaxID=3412482 RepID=UPI003C2D7170
MFAQRVSCVTLSLALTLFFIAEVPAATPSAPVNKAKTMQPASSVSSMKTTTDQQLQAIVSQPQRPLASLSVIAIRDGSVVYEQQFGKRYIAAEATASLPVNADTLFRVASVSKMVTALGLMRLVEQGKLTLDTDVSRYLGYTLRNPYYPDVAITLRMLLSHTSSLRDDGGYNFPANVSLQSVLQAADKSATPTVIWARPDASNKNYAPGSYFSYVNLNWGVIGSVMEAVSGQRFDVLMQELILQPLHISGSFHPENLNPAELSNLATLYRKQKNDVWDTALAWQPQVDDYHQQGVPKRTYLATYRPGWNATLFSPQGGLRISACGLSRLMQMLMREGELDGVRVLQPASVRALLTPQWRYDIALQNGDDYQGMFQSWALGFQVFTDTSAAHHGDRLTPPVTSGGHGFTGVGHLGFAYGLESGFVFDPQTRNGMIYLIGGTGADPDKNTGEYSSLSLWQEQIMTALAKQLR